MSVSESPTPWHIAFRLQSLQGEDRANGLRVLGIALFYAVHLVNLHGLSLGPMTLPPVEGLEGNFHAMVTALTVAWVGVSTAVLLALRNRIFPPILQYLSAAADVVLLTCVLLIADGPQSPMLLAYFLIIGMASLRLNPRLVAFTTLAVLLAYGYLGLDVLMRRPELAVAPHVQVTTALALALAGLLAAQALWAAQAMAERYRLLAEAAGMSDAPANVAPSGSDS